MNWPTPTRPAPATPSAGRTSLELLDAGIDVYTTLNVQHVESLNDVVAQITGVTVRETVPDAVLERADEIELVDVTPDELLQRLREGKVYLPEQASRALDQFFRKGNLIALRELALRRTAERVDAQMRGYMRSQGIRETWAASERLRCASAPSGRRPAGPRRAPDGGATPRAVDRGLRRGPRPGDEDGPRGGGARLPPRGGTGRRDGHAVRGDRRRGDPGVGAEPNVTRLMVGKPQRAGCAPGFRGSLLDGLVAGSGGIDVHVITGEADDTAPAGPFRPSAAVRPSTPGGRHRRAGHGGGLALRVVLGTTDTAMLYLLRRSSSGRASAAPGAPGLGAQHRGVRLLLCAAVLHLRGRRRTYVLTFGDDAGGGARHGPAHRPHPGAGRSVPRREQRTATPSP